MYPFWRIAVVGSCVINMTPFSNISVPWKLWSMSHLVRSSYRFLNWWSWMSTLCLNGKDTAKPKHMCLIIRISWTSLTFKHKLLKCACPHLARDFPYNLLGSHSHLANLLSHLQLILTLPTTNMFSVILGDTYCMFAPNSSLFHMTRSPLWREMTFVWIASAGVILSNNAGPFTGVGSAKNHTIHCCTWRFRMTLTFIESGLISIVVRLKSSILLMTWHVLVTALNSSTVEAIAFVEPFLRLT